MFIGRHSPSVSKSHSECSCRMGTDFRYSPTAIATTNSRLLTVSKAISCAAMRSFNKRLFLSDIITEANFSLFSLFHAQLLQPGIQLILRNLDVALRAVLLLSVGQDIL